MDTFFKKTTNANMITGKTLFSISILRSGDITPVQDPKFHRIKSRKVITNSTANYLQYHNIYWIEEQGNIWHKHSKCSDDDLPEPLIQTLFGIAHVYIYVQIGIYLVILSKSFTIIINQIDLEFDIF